MAPKIRIDVSELERLRRIEEQHGGEAAREASLLNNVIDALGLRSSYEDVTTEQTGVTPVRMRGPRGEELVEMREMVSRHTVTGASQFKADVLKAADAAHGAEALNRIREAMKEAQP